MPYKLVYNRPKMVALDELVVTLEKTSAFHPALEDAIRERSVAIPGISSSMWSQAFARDIKLMPTREVSVIVLLNEKTPPSRCLPAVDVALPYELEMVPFPRKILVSVGA